MNSTPGGERRSSARRTSVQCPWLLAARLRPGRQVRVVDFSAGGALVEVTARLLPGATVVLHILGVNGPHTVRATVLRCCVAALDRATGVRYRAALAFEESFEVPPPDTGQGDIEPAIAGPLRGGERVVATPLGRL